VAGNTPLESETSLQPELTTASEPETTTPSCSAAPCDEINQQITVDSSNSSAITTAINQVYATWNQTEKNVFAGYKKRIEAIVWGVRTSINSLKVHCRRAHQLTPKKSRLQKWCLASRAMHNVPPRFTTFRSRAGEQLDSL
jgi:hypothetical protein